MSALVNIKVDESGFSRMVTDYAAVAGKSMAQAFIYQTGLLAGELIKRTPPFAGKTIKRMLEARQEGIALSKAGESMGPFQPKGINDKEVESLSALAVGKRRVETDIRKVVYGLTGATFSERHMAVSGRGHSGSTEWGTLQKCEGKQAVRLFATKDAQVFGADISEWVPQANLDTIRAHHDSMRNKRGRVTITKNKTRQVGRWNWLNVLITTEAMVKKYVKWRQDHVGQAKGGWAKAYMLLGGRMSKRGWVGKHANSAGEMEPATPIFAGNHISIRIINRSSWATGGDPDNIMAAAMAGRSKAIAGDIRGRLEGLWGSRARRMAA